MFLTGLLLFLASVSAVAGPGTAGNGAPPVSTEACRQFKLSDEAMIRSGQARRDYSDNQLAFYTSVAQKIYAQVKDEGDALNKNYRHFPAVEKPEIPIDGPDMSQILYSVNKDLRKSLYKGGYVFCPAGAITTGGKPFCAPNTQWKQIENLPPYGVAVQGVSFYFGGSDSNVPYIRVNVAINDVEDFDHPGVVPLNFVSKDVNFPIDTGTAADVLRAIWPNPGAPSLSPRPEQILQSDLARNPCGSSDSGTQVSGASDKPRVVQPLPRANGDAARPAHPAD